MINKFIIPFLIIIFSLLVIYYILNKINKKYFIENFKELIVKNSEDQIIYINSEEIDIENDMIENDTNELFESPSSIITTKIKNSPNNELPYLIYSLKGTWTNNNSIVKNNIIYNTTIIDISDELNPIVIFKYENKKNIIYKIKEINDNSIICKNSNNILYIRLLNDKTDDKIYKNTLVQYNGQKCLYSFYKSSSTKPYLRYISYQILKQPVDNNLLNIVKAKDWNIDFVKEPYDFKTYNIIVGKYKFPKKIMQVKYSKNSNNNNKNTFKLIKEKYPSGITFYIRRVYKSPNKKNKEIKTHISKPFKLLIKNEDEIPEMLKIISFEADKKINSLGKYKFNKSNEYVPKCTYIYVAQLYHKTDQFKNTPMKKVNKNNFNLHKNAKNMFNNNIEFINLNKLVKNITYTYKMVYVNALYYSKEKEKNKTNPYVYNISFNEILKKL